MFRLIFLSIFWVSQNVSAQILVEDPAAPKAAQTPRVGKEAATDYFKKRESVRGRSPASSADRVLMLHMGTFVNDKAYRWGKKSAAEEVGDTMLGVTYRVGEWKNSMDLFIRAELMSYTVDDKKPLKLSFMPIIAFPDARSDFPMYFGAGAGAGIFFKQVSNESDLSFDYALIVGARFPELFDSGGIFIESGLKGQVHVLSSGQHDGVFVSFGGMFSF